MSKSAVSVAAALCAAAALFTACSQNAGFAPPPVPGPVAPGPQSSGAVNGSALPVGANGANASPGSSPAASALTLVSATGRYAYDGSDTDPTKAPRYVELAFAVKNATSKPITIAKISVASDAGAAIGDSKLSITLTPGSTSDVTLVAFKMKKEAPFAKAATMTFLDDAGKTLISGNADLPPTDLPFVPLDPKDPKGGTSVDGVEVSPVVVAGGAPHYEITFALTNAADTKVDIDAFSLGPTKASLVKAAIPVTIPERTTTGFISIIMPFKGKTLPDGDYAVNAMSGTATVAKATGAML
ncbi:MAG: hypothetical protein JOY86_08210 [Candidatus Eremiobacteraeota bacterium]|nr:hypothetical protein [Candidatus Eremiobacteraeota bacterium]